MVARVSTVRLWLVVAALLIAVAATALWVYPRLCPACHLGIVRKPEAVASRGDVEPSKNLAIWNGSYHGPDYEDYSKICTRCWMAYHDGLRFWQRAIETPDAFRRPLSAAIRQVPLPPKEHVHYRVVYTEKLSDREFSESVAFWCDDIPEVLAPLRDYASKHKLFFGIDDPPRQPGEQFVRIETKPPTI